MDYHQAGVTDNRDFLIHLFQQLQQLQQPDFKQAQLSTDFIEQHPFNVLSSEQYRQILVAATLYQYESNAVKTEYSSDLSVTPMLFYIHDQPFLVRVQKKQNLYELNFFNGSCTTDDSYVELKISCNLSAGAEIKNLFAHMQLRAGITRL